MIETGVICLTALVIAYLGRGAHDLRLRERGEARRDVMAKRDVTLAEQASKRVEALEPRVAALEDAERNRGNLAALRKGR